MVYDKIIVRNQLAKLGETFRKHKIRCVTTNGVFDLFGAHHLAFLQDAKSLADVLIVGVNSDESTCRLKGPYRPIISETDRAAIIAGLECVNHVYIFSEATPEAWLELLKPDAHVKDERYAGNCPEAAIIERNCGKMVYRPILPHESTTDLIRRIKGAEPIPVT